MIDAFDLTGRIAVVTGSSRGIGRATVEMLARAGASVIVSSRTADTCEPVAAELAAAGLSSCAIPCHIGREAELRGLVDGTLDRFGRLDILVCNAAINPVYGRMSELSPGTFEKILQVNVGATLTLCNLALPHICENGGGSIVLISSIAGFRASPNIGGYGVSKAADMALARNLAVEWGPRNVRVNAIAPGLVRTDFAKALWEDPERIEKAEKRVPLRRLGEPEDIAGVVLFLASDAAAFVTGQTITADGGEIVA